MTVEKAEIAELKDEVHSLQDRIGQYDKLLLGMEGTMSLILEEQMGYKRDLYIFKQDVNKRFDKSEELLITIVNHLAKK
ncbi:hypothetical protein [Endozoicomonas sp. 2B-B]